MAGVARRLRTCTPDEVPALLAGALAGDYVLAPWAGGPDAPFAGGDPVSEPDAAVIVTTSGSTGTPKQVVLSARAITAAADSFRERYGAFTWHLALPSHYVAGLMVWARGLGDQPHGGGGVRQAGSDLGALAPGPGRNAISLVPTQLVRALRSPQTTALLAGFDAVLLGGAAAGTELLSKAQQAGIPVLTSYGMSETCGGCVFEARPLPGVEIDIDQASGRISIGGPQLFSGYRGDAGATAAALDDGWLRTNDRGEWVADEPGEPRLRVLGRFDDVVISGGVNVDLAQVQRVVDALGGGAVVGVPDPEWGARVVLATTDQGRDLAAWRDALRSRLPAAALPRQLLVVPKLPRTSSGKIDRQAIQRAAIASKVVS